MRSFAVSVAVVAVLSMAVSPASAREAKRKPIVTTEIADVSAGGCVGGHCSGQKAVSNKVCAPPRPGYQLIPGSEEIHHTIRKDDHGTISPETAVTVVNLTPDEICIIATASPVAAEHQARAAGYATVWEKKKGKK